MVIVRGSHGALCAMLSQAGGGGWVWGRSPREDFHDDPSTHVSCSGAAARRFAVGGVNAAALVDVQSNGSSARVSSLSIEPASGHLILAGAADGPFTLSARRPAPLGNASAAAPPLTSGLSAGAAGRPGAFVARVDADGSPLWVCVLHGNGSKDDPGFTVTSVAADAPGGGGVFVAGVFSPGAGAAGAALACARAGAPAQSYAAPVGSGAAGAGASAGGGFLLRLGVLDGALEWLSAPLVAADPETVRLFRKKADTRRPDTCLARAFSAARPHARGTAGRRG
jgi:hypothetical protein